MAEDFIELELMIKYEVPKHNIEYGGRLHHSNQIDHSLSHRQGTAMLT